jgi:hypothetical protein
MVHRAAGTAYRILGCFPNAIAVAGVSCDKFLLVVTEDRGPSRRLLSVCAVFETHIVGRWRAEVGYAPKAPEAPNAAPLDDLARRPGRESKEGCSSATPVIVLLAGSHAARSS